MRLQERARQEAAKRQLLIDFSVADMRHAYEHHRQQFDLVIACDTDVVLDDEVLGKPGSPSEAREYLDRMSGRAHTVMGGLVVVADGEERIGVERTTVVFKDLSEPEKDRYVAFGEWEGRSGGYAIQTLGSSLVERLEGSVSNVVGLPVGLLAELAPELFERA